MSECNLLSWSYSHALAEAQKTLSSLLSRNPRGQYEILLFQSQQLLTASSKLLNALQNTCGQHTGIEVREMFTFLLENYAKEVTLALGNSKDEEFKMTLTDVSIGATTLENIVRFLEPQEWMYISELQGDLGDWGSHFLNRSVKLNANRDRYWPTSVTFSQFDTQPVGLWDASMHYDSTEDVEVEICCSDHCYGIPYQLEMIQDIKKLKVTFGRAEASEDPEDSEDSEESRHCSGYTSMIGMVCTAIEKHCKTLEEFQISIPAAHWDFFHQGVNFDCLSLKSLKIVLTDPCHRYTAGGGATEVKTFLQSLKCNLDKVTLEFPCRTQMLLMEQLCTSAAVKDAKCLLLSSCILKSEAWASIAEQFQSCSELSLVDFRCHNSKLSFSELLYPELSIRLKSLSLEVSPLWYSERDEWTDLDLRNLLKLKLTGDALTLKLIGEFCANAQDLHEIELGLSSKTYEDERSVMGWMCSNLPKHKNLRKFISRIRFFVKQKLETFEPYDRWEHMTMVRDAFPLLQECTYEFQTEKLNKKVHLNVYLSLISMVREMTEKCKMQERPKQKQSSSPVSKKRKIEQI
jgi:hypothetical protein